MTSDVVSPNSCAKGDCHHQERSFVSPIHLSRSLTPFITARPQIQPNYGFMKTLHAFEACHYSVSSTESTYRTWKRRHRQDVTCFLNSLSDTTVIIPEKLSLSRKAKFEILMLTHV